MHEIVPSAVEFTLPDMLGRFLIVLVSFVPIAAVVWARRAEAARLEFARLARIAELPVEGNDIPAVRRRIVTRQTGRAIGMAFQITDDLLDITASSDQGGKPVGNDLRQGVLTLPVIYAMHNSPHGEELRRLIAARAMSDVDIEQGLALIRDTDAVEYCYRRAGEYLATARRSLPTALPGDVLKSLKDIADFIGLRKY